MSLLGKSSISGVGSMGMWVLWWHGSNFYVDGMSGVGSKNFGMSKTMT